MGLGVGVLTGVGVGVPMQASMRVKSSKYNSPVEPSGPSQDRERLNCMDGLTGTNVMV